MSRRLETLRTAVFVTAAPALCGCATSVPSAPLDRFMAGDLEPVRSFYDRELREGDAASGALYMNGLAQTELLAGEVEAARRHFLQAGLVMGNWATPGSEVFGAVVGSESSKTWKGDPYEKAMNAYYLGLCYWILGEPDNARAAFKKGILADAESDEGIYQVDFALLYWLAGRMSLYMGLPDEAGSYFEEALSARGFAVDHGAAGLPNPSVLTDPGAGNLICLVDIGLGPRKVAGGSQGELAVMERHWSEARGAEIFVDGASVGQTELLGDIDYQAMTRGGQAMEGIRKGKAVFKTASEVAGAVLMYEGLKEGGKTGRGVFAAGLGFLLLSLLTSASADVRHWQILPQSVQVLTALVPPGEHELRVEFLAAGGGVLPALTQTWAVEIPESGESVYYFRSLPGLDQVRGVVQ